MVLVYPPQGTNITPTDLQLFRPPNKEPTWHRFQCSRLWLVLHNNRQRNSTTRPPALADSVGRMSQRFQRYVLNKTPAVTLKRVSVHVLLYFTANNRLHSLLKRYELVFLNLLLVADSLTTFLYSSELLLSKLSDTAASFPKIYHTFWSKRMYTN